jgi:CubicO group peptidase (beta-lactamase class C family)
VPSVTGIANELVDAVFDDTTYGPTYASIIVQGGDVLAERYGGALPHFDRDDEPVTADTPLLSWSIAKSVLHTAVGVLVGDGRLEIEQPAAVPEWSAPGDPRRAITVDQLLQMRDGLDFLEDYVDDRTSDVIAMLFGEGQADAGHFAADRPLKHEPGTVFNYSSGSSNILSRIVSDLVGSGAATEAFLRERVFDPIGMPTATIRMDEAGTWIGSSYVYATARDWVRFGEFAKRDGAGVVPDGWVAHGRRERSIDPTDGRPYGAHWWILRHPRTVFYASGYEGQRVVTCPELDLVFVRFGRSSGDAHYNALRDWCGSVVDSLA